MTRVFITGANGHLGTNIVRSLLPHGHEVVPFVRRTSLSQVATHQIGHIT